MNSNVDKDIDKDITKDFLLNRLYLNFKQKKYLNIYICIHYIHTRKSITNKYFNNSPLDNYLCIHTPTHIERIFDTFYKSIIIYNFINKYKYHNKEKIIVNDINLYGESIEHCKQDGIYLKCNKTKYDNKYDNKYHIFTCSELNKIITNALLFTFEHDNIISSRFPKNPWTNKKFTINELEYIVYKFKHYNFHYHKIIVMFHSCNFSIKQLSLDYNYYLHTVSVKSYIKNLDRADFLTLFNSFWLSMSYSRHSRRSRVRRRPEDRMRLGNIICKHCVLSIPTLQLELNNILSIYYLEFHNTTPFSNDDFAALNNLKYKFLTFLIVPYPHVYKNDDYYHLHYNKYNTERFKKKHFTFTPLIDFPIHGFTDDCKPIYNCNGVKCILQNQMLVSI